MPRNTLPSGKSEEEPITTVDAKDIVCARMLRTAADLVAAGDYEEAMEIIDNVRTALKK